MSLSVEDQRTASEIFTSCMQIMSLDRTWTARLDAGQLAETERDALVSIGYSLASELERIHGKIGDLRRIGSESGDAEATATLARALEVLGQNIDDECKRLATKCEQIKSGQPPEGDIAQVVLGAIIFGAGLTLSAGGGFVQRFRPGSSQAQVQTVAGTLMTVGAGLMAT